MINGLSELNYETRCKKIGINYTRNELRGDLIEVFKIVKGYDDSCEEILFFVRSSASLRGHQLKLHKKC